MKSTLFSTRHWFTQWLERTQAKFSVRVALTIALTLTYGGGLWLHLAHQADGATELNAPPPVIHWLRDSTLMLPLVLVSVFAALFFARWLLARFGGNASRILEGAVVVASIALITSVALAAASPIHNSLFHARHPAHQPQGDLAALLARQPGNSEIRIALQQGDTEKLIALQGEAETSRALQGNAETPIAPQPDDVEMPLALHMLYDGTLALLGNLVLASILFALFGGRIRVSELVLSAQPLRR